MSVAPILASDGELIEPDAAWIAQRAVDAASALSRDLLPLSPRRFWLAALSLGITEDMVDARIEVLPEPQRSAYRIEKRHAQSYERTHPLVQSLPQAFGVTHEALDAAWLNAPA